MEKSYMTFRVIGFLIIIYGLTYLPKFSTGVSYPFIFIAIIFIGSIFFWIGSKLKRDLEKVNSSKK